MHGLTTTRRTAFRLLGAGAMLPLAIPLLCARSLTTVVIVTSRQVATFAAAADAVGAAVAHSGGSIATVDVSGGADVCAQLSRMQPDLIVSVGTDAANGLDHCGTHAPTLAVMSLQSGLLRAPDAGRMRYAVGLDVPPALVMRQLKRWFPGKSRMGIIRNPLRRDPSAAELTAAGQALGFTVQVAECAAPKDVLPVFQSLAGSVDFVWCMPDGSLYNGTTVRPLILAAIERRVALIGFSESFLRSGAAVAAFPDFRKATSEAVESVREYLAGSGRAGQKAGYFQFGVNQQVLRLLQIRVSPGNGADSVMVVN